jgi:tRNA pseudouridine32 synthase/23S rRNA pseudouridine746 synthase
MNRLLVEQFKLRQVQKYYLAIGIKKPKKKQGLIKGDMAQARRGAWKLMPTQENSAVTQFFSTAVGEGKRLFIVKPHTGKTHQIRVALKSIGSPILGDTLYADVASCEGVDRVYLHAYSLAFWVEGKLCRFTCAPREGEHYLSQDFLQAAQSFLSPWDLVWPPL